MTSLKTEELVILNNNYDLDSKLIGITVQIYPTSELYVNIEGKILLNTSDPISFDILSSYVHRSMHKLNILKAIYDPL